MPRHEKLIPLSHDHHQALLIALRLKKGGPVSPNDHLWPKEPDKQLRFLKLFFEQELLPHFRIEEEVLFPAAVSLEGLRETVETLMGQHAQMKDMIGTIIRQKDDPQTLETVLVEFGKMLEQHVRIEERQLFPALEAAENQGQIVLPALR